MGLILNNLLVSLTLLLAVFAFRCYRVIQPPEVPQLGNTWWGKGDGTTISKQDTSIRPFKIQFSDQELQDLQYRLDHTRTLQPPLEGIQQQYGINTNLLNEIVDFWRTKYNWREREKYLNQFPQFKTNIQGLDIHYIHVKPKKVAGLKVLPLLMLHGWPGSVREFYEIIPLLTTPQPNQKYIFEVIVPSLPGYGFSSPAVIPGLGAAQMAVVFKNLMERLGFNQYYTQGGDFGAYILHHMAVFFPEEVLGFHSNMCTAYTPLSYLKTFLGLLYSPWVVKPEHYDRVYPLSKHFYGRMYETGYLHLQATKPDTLGVGLTDSPAGLAGYILEKFTTLTNATWQLREDGGLKLEYSYEDLLDNVMIYWITNSATTSVRLYAETFSKAHLALGGLRIPIKVPTACARFKNDLYAPDGLIYETRPNLLQVTDHDGGHFAAFQKPKVLAKDIYSAVKNFEAFNKKH